MSHAVDEVKLMPTYILGISAFYHDSAACLLRDGRIVAAAQEERFTRKKFDADFPSRASRYCLEAGGIGLRDFKYIVFYDKPLIKFERLLETYVSFAPKGIQSFVTAIPVWLKEKLLLKKRCIRNKTGINRKERKERIEKTMCSMLTLWLPPS
jgi:predicted NodU family carbamoyl transferase